MTNPRSSEARRKKHSRVQDPGHCSILALPNELLSLIVRNCDPPTLLLAASLYKQLNDIAISYYLTQIGFEPRSVVIGHQEITFLEHQEINVIPFSALRGLRLAFSVKSVGNITCYLPHECTTELREMQLWLDCLSSIGCLCLHFNPSRIHRPPELKSASIAEVLRVLFGKQCSRFCVTGDVRTDAKKPDESMMMITTLMAADIGTTALFSDPFVDWTVSSLNGSSNLQTLNLQNVKSKYGFLYDLRLPALRALDITSADFSRIVLPLFLSRHPQLETLSLKNVQLEGYARTSTVSDVQMLTFDSIDLVQELLHPKSTLPKLTSISFMNDAPRNTPTNVASRLGTLFRVISLRPQIKSLSLELTVAEAIIPWLQMGYHPRHCHRYKDKRPLDEIVDLTVICSERSVVSHLPPWLILFPQLKKLIVQQSSFPWEDEEMVDFVRSAKEICAELDVVSFSPITKSVNEWLF